MKGLIIKDLLLLKNNMKIMGLLLIIYIIFAFLGIMDISFILPFIALFSFISTFSWDELNKWDTYAITLPEGRKNVVKAKYLLTFLLLIFILLISFVLSCLIAYYQKNTIDFKAISLNLIIINITFLIIPIVMYPLIYKFGIEKARLSFFFVFFGLIFAGYLLLKFFPIFNLDKLNYLEPILPFIYLLLIFIFYYISYLISKKIFLNKEL